MGKEREEYGPEKSGVFMWKQWKEGHGEVSDEEIEVSMCSTKVPGLRQHLQMEHTLDLGH